MAPPRAPKKGRQTRPGAPDGNLNFCGGDTRQKELALLGRLSKRERREQMDVHRRTAEKEARAILRECNLGDSPLAARIARRLADIETEIARVQILVNGSHGRFNKERQETPAYSRLMQLIGTDRAEIVKLLDRLTAAMAAAGPAAQGDVKYVCTFDDGTPVGDHPQNSAAQHAPAPEAPEAAQAPVQSEKGEAVQRSLDRKLRRHTEARAACDGLLVPDAKEPRDDDETARRQAQYLWDHGWTGTTL
ncbi:MAG: hypothetical protein MUF27_03655 [Acidobacteria bacterium]|nr:hypothetical protein [Acidobacteriota bacterium]